jgi:hypothetical protein
MPNKHNAERRHHIPKMKFRVRNWAQYDAALRRRGSLTLWVTHEVMAGWRAPPRSTRGVQPSYSDLAIETGLMLRLAFHLPLRQTEGLMASIFELLEVALSVPDHSTFSRRAMKLTSISKGCRLPDGPVHLLIDSTGLKVFGAGEWLQERHGARARRTWRKLHLAVDADTGTVMASILTGNDVGDPSQVAPLIDQITPDSPTPSAACTELLEVARGRGSFAGGRYPCNNAFLIPSCGGPALTAKRSA